MATIIADPFVSQAPSTPVKGGVTVTTSEAAPDYSPGAVPTYVANAKAAVDTDAGNDEDADTNAYKPSAEQTSALETTDINALKMPSSKQHPILPIGNVIYDVRNHLTCHQNFNMNIETLMAEFLLMKKELSVTRSDLAQSQRDVQREREEKEGYKNQCEALEAALKEVQIDLSEVRLELVASEERLRSAITQITDLAKRLEDTKTLLRLRTKERDTLSRKNADLEREIQHIRARVQELQIALEIADAGENAANDRNTRLTAMLYEVERAKAAIERKKDQAEARIRELVTTENQLREELRKGVENSTLVLQLRLEIQGARVQISQLEADRKEARELLSDRERKIGDLERGLQKLGADFDMEVSFKKSFRELARQYEGIARRLPHEKCRNRFPQVKLMTDEACLESFTIMAEPDAEREQQVEEAAPLAEESSAEEASTVQPETVAEPEANTEAASSTNPGDQLVSVAA